MIEGAECFIRKGIGEQPVKTNVMVEPETDPAGTPGSTGDKAGEQSTKFVAVDESGADSGTTTGANPEQDKKMALILRISGSVAKNLIEQNPSNEALQAVIDHCLPKIGVAIGSIVIVHEPYVSQK